MTSDGRRPPDGSQPPAGSRPLEGSRPVEVSWRPPSGPGRRAGACALLAIVLAVLLPLAPVLVNSPTVRWPVDPRRPTSTLLTVTSYRPVTLDVRFSCRAVRAAAETDFSATVVSTVNPLLPEVAHLGLIASVVGERLTVDAVGSRLVRERLPAGDCRYRVHGDARSGLVLDRDGVPLGRGPAGVLPDVDLLVTSLAALPGGTDADLGVTLRLDDEFATTPTGFKTVLTVLLVLALLAVALALAQLDRAVPRVPRPRGVPRPHPADAVVVLALLGWLLLAPSTDDDGYYAAMATNSRYTGFVGNYYQFYDQSFTPITWFYQLLAWWQTLAGAAPVAQRMLALTAGLLTWFVVRTLVSAALRQRAPRRGPDESATGPLVRLLAPAVAAAAFLAWWLPQNMGVRPESAVALLAVAALLGVWVAIRRQRLLAAWAACAAGGLALATHTTGFVGLAPLMAGAGGLWALVRVPGPGGRTAWERTLPRALAVVSGATTSCLAGFADGSLRDFLRAQQIFLDIQHREYWYTEHLRWFYLLSDIPMGNYAKRVAVLVAVVGLVWFLVLSVAGRARGQPVALPLRLTGWTLVASFGLLSFTPSKWTHHFGALAGVGPAFLTLLLVSAVPLARRVVGGGRVPAAVLLAAAGSTLIAFVLAGRGRDSWPYAWMFGFPDPNTAPAAAPFAFDSALSWLVALAGCVALGWVWTLLPRFGADGARDRRGPAVLRGVALFVVAGLVLNIAYLLGSFTLAARNTAGSWSLWAAAAADPGARRCGVADAIGVFDPFGARPLPVVELDGSDSLDDGDDPAVTRDDAAGSTGFERAGGYYLGYQPPVQLGTGAATTVWGSLLPADGKPPDRNVAEMRTPWYRLPDGIGADRAVAVLVAGTTNANAGNSLSAEYAGLGSADLGSADLGSADLDDDGSGPRWRSVLLTPPPRAELVRLHAVDNSAGPSGWLAFAAPAVQNLVPLRELLAARLPAGPVALGWQIAFRYPCLRQPVIRDGITEPPVAAVLWAGTPFSGTRDPTWLASRGGIHGQLERSRSVLQLTARVWEAPDEQRLEVLVFDAALSARSSDPAYLVRTTQRRVNGYTDSVPPPTRTLNDLERCVQDAALRRAADTVCTPKPIP